MTSVARKPVDKSRFEPEATPPGGPCPLDLVHLARQSLGDRGLEGELLSLFSGQCAQILAQIEASAAAGRHGSIPDLAHTLKGSARAVGAFAVAEAAGACEIARSGELPAAVARLDAAVAAARAVIVDLLAER